jgi:D-aminopeptidase
MRIFLGLFLSSGLAFGSARIRDFGVVIGKTPTGKLNAITDVDGVRVGQVTLNSGSGKLVVGKGPVRTGVTAIVPGKDPWDEKPMAGSFVLNGNGEATGLMWMQESGFLETPIALTNTLSVAAAQKGLVDWMVKENPEIGITDDTVVPMVMECDDSSLNDIRGQHVTAKHTFDAVETAKGGPVEEGAVGAGTGMMTYEFKGGIGTSSRVLAKADGGYTVGVLLNANHGTRHTLRVLGAPIGELITDLIPAKKQEGSIVIVLATNAPLDSRQLARMAKRTLLGIARTGATARHGSGDLAVAFTTKNRVAHYPKRKTQTFEILSDVYINPLFEAAVDAAEEAMLNALVAAKTTEGRDNFVVHGIPHDRLRELLKKYKP